MRDTNGPHANLWKCLPVPDSSRPSPKCSFKPWGCSNRLNDKGKIRIMTNITTHHKFGNVLQCHFHRRNAAFIFLENCTLFLLPVTINFSLRFFFPCNVFVFQRRQEVRIRDDHALSICLRTALEPPKFMDLDIKIIPSEDTPAQIF